MNTLSVNNHQLQNNQKQNVAFGMIKMRGPKAIQLVENSTDLLPLINVQDLQNLSKNMTKEQISRLRILLNDNSSKHCFMTINEDLDIKKRLQTVPFEEAIRYLENKINSSVELTKGQFESLLKPIINAIENSKNRAEKLKAMQEKWGQEAIKNAEAGVRMAERRILTLQEHIMDLIEGGKTNRLQNYKEPPIAYLTLRAKRDQKLAKRSY